MRALTDHIVDGDSANHQLTIEVTDEPGQGGACHGYVITGMSMESNPSDLVTQSTSGCRILFQNGPIKESGVNGVTQEALLAIVIDRLRSFQAGPFKSEENADALHYCEQALGSLQVRTLRRIRRGVEGTHQK